MTQDSKTTNGNVSSAEGPMAPKNCPLCNSPLVLRRSRNGYILGCSNFPVCEYVENVAVQGVSTVKLIEGSKCPECGSLMAVKKSRFGMFVGCSAYPDCNYIYTDNQEDGVTCPVCGKGVLRHRANKFGKSFYSCTNFKNCSYIVYYKPVERTCPKCGFPIMLQRRRSSGIYYQCPRRDCRYKEID